MTSNEDLLPSLAICNRAAKYTKLLRKGSSPKIEFNKRWSNGGGDYSVYCLLENAKHVRYIGITCQSLESRLAQHFSDCGRGNNIYKENWLRKCKKNGTTVIIHPIRARLTIDQACMIEEMLIHLLKKPFRLTNTHAGGSLGYAGLSEESKEKHKLSMHSALLKSSLEAQEIEDMERGFCLIELEELHEGVSTDMTYETLQVSRQMKRAPKPENSNKTTLENTAPIGWENTLRKSLRLNNYSYGTERSYVNWAKRFAEFIKPLKPDTANSAQAEEFLSHLAIVGEISRTSQKQAINAIFHLMQDTLAIDLGQLEILAAENIKKTEPKALSSEECLKFLRHCRGHTKVISQTLYSTGMRISELVNLRISNINLDESLLYIPGARFERIERVVPISTSLALLLKKHLEQIKQLWIDDTKNESLGGVMLSPEVLKDQPDAPYLWEHQWLFPSKTPEIDPRTGAKHRHHIQTATLRQSIKKVALEASITKQVTPSILRKSFTKHMTTKGIQPSNLKTILG